MKKDFQMSDDPTTFTLKNFKMLSLIGRGAFAKVILVRSKLDDRIYVLKVLKRTQVEACNHRDRVEIERDVLVHNAPIFMSSVWSIIPSSSKCLHSFRTRSVYISALNFAQEGNSIATSRFIESSLKSSTNNIKKQNKDTILCSTNGPRPWTFTFTQYNLSRVQNYHS